MNRNNIH